MMMNYEQVKEQMGGRDEVLVACRHCGWNNAGRLVMVDRYATDHPPIPWMDLREVYSDTGCDPDDLSPRCPNPECPEAGVTLWPDEVVVQ